MCNRMSETGLVVSFSYLVPSLVFTEVVFFVFFEDGMGQFVKDNRAVFTLYLESK